MIQYSVMKKITLLAAIMMVAMIVGCDSVSNVIFSRKFSPDEFSVITRAPLSVPRDFDLKAPQPGALRPQEVTPRNQAKQAVLGQRPNPSLPVESENKLAGSRGVMIILRDTGGLKAPSDIRQTINNEADNRITSRVGITDKILFWESKELYEVVVHPLKEAHRIKEAKAKGEKVTGQGSVIISRRDDPTRSFLDKILFD
jgi:hypothetical protein